MEDGLACRASATIATATACSGDRPRPSNAGILRWTHDLCGHLIHSAHPAEQFGESGRWTATGVEPLYRATLWFDRHRLAELDADADGRPYHTDDPRWAFSLATFAAARIDSDIARAYQSLTALLATTGDLLAEPGLAEITKLGSHAPHSPCPGRDATSCSPLSAHKPDRRIWRRSC